MRRPAKKNAVSRRGDGAQSRASRWELAMPAAVVGPAATVIVAGVVARAVVAVIVTPVVVGAGVVAVVVLMPHPVVVLERVERGADVRLDGELVRRIRRVEDGGARGEPGARVEVDGDVLALAVDHELAFQLLLGLERGAKLERGALKVPSIRIDAPAFTRS